jgi:hypothetical protein
MNKTVLKTSFWTAFSDSLIITFEASHSTFYNARSWQRLTESTYKSLNQRPRNWFDPFKSHAWLSSYSEKSRWVPSERPYSPGTEYGFHDLLDVQAIYLNFI